MHQRPKPPLEPADSVSLAVNMLRTDRTDRSESLSELLNWESNADYNRVRKRASSRRQYQKRKTVGLCAYFGCSAQPEADRRYCQKHLVRMSASNRNRCKARKDDGLCVYCGMRPQFWGVRCLVCRQRFNQDSRRLPFGARRALRLYRAAERLAELEQLQTHARFAIRKLLAMEDIKGEHARALRLYAGLDNGCWRTYQEVGRLMHLSKERVRQLLHPSKVILTKMLDGNVPWRPLSPEPDRRGQEKKQRAFRQVRDPRSFLNVQAVISSGEEYQSSGSLRIQPASSRFGQ